MASSQDIEARLCAYIDGDLDPDRRAEIEQHFRAYPQHRQMIQDLIQTRALVTELPRISAPADLGEGLQGQIERSILLGDQSTVREPRVHSGHLIRWFATAAVATLSIGLATAVYLIVRVPAHRDTPPVAVMTVPPPPLPSAPLVEPATQPSPAPPVAIVPATQPVQVAAALPPATQPVEMDDADDMDQAEMDDIDPNSPPDAAVAASADATLAADSTAPLIPAVVSPSPATQPVADDAGDK
jgi:anti-sigma factor RsiW